MGYEDQGTGADPGAAGHELQGRDAGAKNREVAPAVMGVMAALKDSAEWFRAAAAVEGEIRWKGRAPAAMAEKCERAIAELEGMLAASFQRVADATDRPKAPPSPSALFRAGFDYGGMAARYELASDEAKEKLGAPPPPDWPTAWAITRAQLAVSAATK